MIIRLHNNDTIVDTTINDIYECDGFIHFDKVERPPLQMRRIWYLLFGQMYGFKRTSLYKIRESEIIYIKY